MPLSSSKRRTLRLFGFDPTRTGRRRRKGPAAVRHRTSLQALERRLLLAGDLGDIAFMRSLPSASDAEFGAPTVNQEGKAICLAFHTGNLFFSTDSGDGDGEGGPESSASVDLTAAIAQQAGPLAPGAAFTSEITFENASNEAAAGATLAVTFDNRLENITWTREVIRAQPAVIDVSTLTPAT
ncbi:MAG: LEPR-XLL domain-containing protein, partial [Planctomycetota bacterium]